MRASHLCTLLFVAFVTSATSPACDAEFKIEREALNARSVILPAMLEICAALGIAKKECTTAKLLSTSRRQTDQALWYSTVHSSPDNQPDAYCYKPVAIERYGFLGGGTGTAYLCKVLPADDRITSQELERISALTERLNSINPKTLEDHERAISVKRFISFLGG